MKTQNRLFSLGSTLCWFLFNWQIRRLSYLRIFCGTLNSKGTLNFTAMKTKRDVSFRINWSDSSITGFTLDDSDLGLTRDHWIMLLKESQEYERVLTGGGVFIDADPIPGPAPIEVTFLEEITVEFMENLPF